MCSQRKTFLTTYWSGLFVDSEKHNHQPWNDPPVGPTSGNKVLFFSACRLDLRVLYSWLKFKTTSLLWRPVASKGLALRRRSRIKHSFCQAFLFLELELKACFLSSWPEGAGPCRCPFNSKTPSISFSEHRTLNHPASSPTQSWAGL